MDFQEVVDVMRTTAVNNFIQQDFQVLLRIHVLELETMPLEVEMVQLELNL
jgi:hypothetical protein